MPTNARTPDRPPPAGGPGGRLLERYVAWKGERQRRREERRAARERRDEIYSRIDDEMTARERFGR
jgi:hypothetical protein